MTVGSASSGLEVRGVVVRRGGAVVLGPLDLRVPPGALWGVVGPNGAGKTTLLRVVAGLERPASGKVSVDGGVPRRGEVGLLAQVAERPPEVPFTVAEVVALGLVGRRRPPAAAGDAVGEALAALGLEELARRRYRELSGGERQKVQLARLVAQDPALLLLDEPAAGLDLEWQERMTALVGDLHGRLGRTVLMVTHDTSRLPAGTSGVLLLQRGRAVAVGRPHEVLTAESLSAAFGTRMAVVERGGRWLAGVAP